MSDSIKNDHGYSLSLDKHKDQTEKLGKVKDGQESTHREKREPVRRLNHIGRLDALGNVYRIDEQSPDSNRASTYRANVRV
jgi:hypothetical protein